MKLNWGILGAGVIAQEMAQALNSLHGQAYAIASRTRGRAETLAGRYAIQKVYSTPEELLADQAVDVVYIATPHNLHYDMMRQALLAGKHVLCEKAITIHSAQLGEIRSLARERGLVVEEAMTLYHMPLYRALLDKVRQGVIGHPRMIQVNFGSCKPYDVSNRFFSKELAGGALLDIGVYALSFARYFLDQAPDRIVTTAGLSDTGVDEQSGIVMSNPAGQMAVISLSMRAKQPKRGVVCGEGGYLEVENYPRADRAVIYHLSGEEPEVLQCGDTIRALEYEVQDMEGRVTGAIHEGWESLTDDVMELMTRIRQQWGLRYPMEP